MLSRIIYFGGLTIQLTKLTLLSSAPPIRTDAALHTFDLNAQCIYTLDSVDFGTHSFSHSFSPIFLSYSLS